MSDIGTFWLLAGTGWTLAVLNAGAALAAYYGHWGIAKWCLYLAGSLLLGLVLALS